MSWLPAVDAVADLPAAEEGARCYVREPPTVFERRDGAWKAERVYIGSKWHVEAHRGAPEWAMLLPYYPEAPALSLRVFAGAGSEDLAGFLVGFVSHTVDGPFFDLMSDAPKLLAALAAHPQAPSLERVGAIVADWRERACVHGSRMGTWSGFPSDRVPPGVAVRDVELAVPAGLLADLVGVASTAGDTDLVAKAAALLPNWSALWLERDALGPEVLAGAQTVEDRVVDALVAQEGTSQRYEASRRFHDSRLDEEAPDPVEGACPPT